MRLALFTLAFASALASTPAFAYSVSCSGYPGRSGGYVYGTCVDGTFNGTLSEGGVYAWGTCTAGGSFSGSLSNGDYFTAHCQAE